MNQMDYQVPVHTHGTLTSKYKLGILLETYSKEKYPSKDQKEEIMAKTGLNAKVIQRWFQNRRFRENGAQISPSSQPTAPAVTPLPPVSASTGTELRSLKANPHVLC